MQHDSQPPSVPGEQRKPRVYPRREQMSTISISKKLQRRFAKNRKAADMSCEEYLDHLMTTAPAPSRSPRKATRAETATA